MLNELSRSLADLAEAAGRSVVHVEARRRGPSSGIAWSQDGLVVTAHHGVEWDEGIPVGLPDGTVARGRVVGRDPGTDVALIETDARGLTPPRWAEAASPRAGELVLVVSRPGRSARARLGVLHAVGGEWRSASGGRLEAHLESDVPVQLGFSGSLLVSADGALGLNTTGLLRGASMAVPAATLARVVGALRSGGGRVRRGYLGIGTQSVALTPDLEARTGQTQALLVLSVQPESPAARAGLLLGDALLAVEGAPTRHPADLLPFLDGERIGQELRLRLLRAGEVREAALTLGERG